MTDHYSNFISFFSNFSISLSLLLINSLIKTVFDNGIKVYGDADTIRQISELIAKYPST